MSTDRELLENAAKAAGVPLLWIRDTPYRDVQATRSPPWNPLTDDGDALRLAVKLGVLVDSHGLHARVCFPYEEPLAYEAMGDDPYAATRRAIVRAAAVIGAAK